MVGRCWRCRVVRDYDAGLAAALAEQQQQRNQQETDVDLHGVLLPAETVSAGHIMPIRTRLDKQPKWSSANTTRLFRV